MADQNALFNQYENEYAVKSTDVARKIQAISSLSGEMKRLKIKEVEADCKEADQIIKRMQMEARSFSAEHSRVLLQKVRDYKADLEKLEKDCKVAAAASSGGDAARAELGLGGDYFSTSAGQRERMLNSTQKMDKTTDRIRQGTQQLLETEDLGVSILQDLHRQRETIVHARDTLHDADDNIGKARRVLASMSRRIMTNKLLMWGIIFMLVAAIFLVLYFKVIHK